MLDDGGNHIRYNFVNRNVKRIMFYNSSTFRDVSYNKNRTHELRVAQLKKNREKEKELEARGKKGGVRKKKSSVISHDSPPAVAQVRIDSCRGCSSSVNSECYLLLLASSAVEKVPRSTKKMRLLFTGRCRR